MTPVADTPRCPVLCQVLSMADLSVKQRVSVGEHGQPWSLSLSPDERYIVIGCSDGNILVRLCVVPLALFSTF